MKVAIYLDIQEKDYKQYHIENYLISSIKHILTDIDSKCELIENPIIYKDDISKEITIK